MRFNLFVLKQQLEIYKGREYSWEEIARKAGLHGHTVRGMADNKKKGADLETLQKIILFFRGEGLNISINDLIVENSDGFG